MFHSAATLFDGTSPIREQCGQFATMRKIMGDKNIEDQNRSAFSTRTISSKATNVF